MTLFAFQLSSRVFFSWLFLVRARGGSTQLQAVKSSSSREPLIPKSVSSDLNNMSIINCHSDGLVVWPLDGSMKINHPLIKRVNS